MQIRLAFRLICLGAVLAATAVILADYYAHTSAWLTYEGGVTIPPGYVTSEAKSCFIVVAPWLAMAAIQIATIRRPSIVLDSVRGLSLITACISISMWWPEMQLWRELQSNPSGEGMQVVNFECWIDSILSYPVCLILLAALSLEKLFASKPKISARQASCE